MHILREPSALQNLSPSLLHHPLRLRVCSSVSPFPLMLAQLALAPSFSLGGTPARVDLACLSPAMFGFLKTAWKT